MIICTAGHRPEKLGGHSNQTFNFVITLAEQVLSQINPTSVVSGMALGWDQAVAIAALRQHIPLISCIPMRGFSSQWPKNSQDIYNRILAKATEIEYVDELPGDFYKKLNGNVPPGVYAPQKMQTRNIRMVEISDLVVALWDGSKSGTSNCLDYAKKVGKPFYNFWEAYQAMPHRQGV